MSPGDAPAGPGPAARGLPATAAGWMAANPYPGLRSFKPGEGDRFFGRGQQIDELLQRLDEVPFVAVSGASGCGKSSLVLAGLLNALARRHADGLGPQWRPVVMRPGSRPIAHLATPLARALRPDGAGSADDADEAARADALNGRLRLGGLGLAEAVRQARLPEGARVLVVVDQFEEIFRFKRVVDPDEASAFVKLLLQAAADADSPVSVVITLRSDTLGECAAFRDLPEAVSRGGYLVPRLKREQRKEAIINPVLLRGAGIAPRLVQRLLNDVSDDFDDLPVMQHVLSRTWQHWAATSAGTRPIDLQDYEAVGGAANALSNHADEACQDLGGATAAGAPAGLVERVFRALTERVGEGTEIRRPLAFQELCAVCGGDTAGVTRVVERYRRADTAFLVPGSEVALADNPVIDISHESLIRLWKRMRGWVQAESDARAELLRLLEDTARHRDEDGELWRGRSLERAREWERQSQPNAAWVALASGARTPAQGEAQWAAAQAFLAASKAAEAQARRRERLRSWGLRGMGVAVVLVSVAAALSGNSLKRQAGSRDLASRAMLEQGQDPARSAHLALAAEAQDPDNPRGQYALRQAMSMLEVARADDIVAFDAPVADARYNGDGSRLVVAAGREVAILDAARLSRLATVKVASSVEHAWLLGELLVTYTDDWRLQLLSLDGKALADLSCGGTGNSAFTAAATPARDGKPAQFAVGCYDGELTLWDIGPQGVLARHALVEGDDALATVTALDFSGDGQWLAAGDNKGSARVWKRGQTDKPFIGSMPPAPSSLQHADAIRDIGFHPSEPTLLTTASDDHTTRVWSIDLVTGLLIPNSAEQKTQHKLQHDRSVQRTRFVARVDDQFRLMTVSDKRVYFWTDEATRDERRHDDTVTDANVSADGEMLVTASNDGTARVWSSRSSTPIAVLRGHRNEVTRAFFAPSAAGGNAGQATVITTSTDRTLRRWRVQAPRLLVAEKTWIHSAVVTPDGQQAVVCGEPVALGGAGGAGSGGTGDDKTANCLVVPLTGSPWARQPLAGASADAVTGLSLSADGKLLLGQRNSLDVAQTARPVLWDLASRKDVTPAWLVEWETAVFNPGRPELMTMDLSGHIALWPLGALAEGQPKPALTLDAGMDRRIIALSPDGRWIAASDGARVTLWDRQTPAAKPLSLADHVGDVRSIAFSRDGGRMVTASADRTARVWSLAGLAAGALAPSQELAGGHSAALSSASFSPDGALVVTGSADNTVRVWDAASGRPLAALMRHSDAVNAVVMHPDGKRILSAADDGTAVLGACEACTMPLATLRRRAAEVVLPEDERQRIARETRVKLHPFMLPRWMGGEQ